MWDASWFLWCLGQDQKNYPGRNNQGQQSLGAGSARRLSVDQIVNAQMHKCRKFGFQYHQLRDSLWSKWPLLHVSSSEEHVAQELTRPCRRSTVSRRPRWSKANANGQKSIGSGDRTKSTVFVWFQLTVTWDIHSSMSHRSWRHI